MYTSGLQMMIDDIDNDDDNDNEIMMTLKGYTALIETMIIETLLQRIDFRKNLLFT